VVISLSPFWFFDRVTAGANGYAGNLSDLHAGELAFNTRLSLQLRQDAARRMLRYPASVADRPLLRFALENLADGSYLGLACYEAILPLGIAHNTILRYQDHWNVVCYLWRHPPRTPPPTAPGGGRALDWPALHRQADAVYLARSDNNPFGLDNGKWNRELRREFLRKKAVVSQESFLHTLRENQEWVDLELLLRELNELGARPLLISLPIHGGWYDQLGVNYNARRVYYRRLRETCARYHAPVVDFADHDADRTFSHDDLGHLAPAGLLHFNQVLDGFFRDAIPRLSEPAAASPGGPSSATAIGDEASWTKAKSTSQGREGTRKP
jgi:D-alanine transfer protein